MMRDPNPEVTSAPPLDVLFDVTRHHESRIHVVMLLGLSLAPSQGQRLALVDAGLLVGLWWPFADPIDAPTPSEGCRVGDERSLLDGRLALRRRCCLELQTCRVDAIPVGKANYLKGVHPDIL